ncbi:SDR family oxidoreductase [Egicoccus halophilus]|uniref:SDR family oxidoreductase n=1 Tax=Egicoccus halophilus TaxID=1670830 RepID=UPI00351A0628
MDFDGRVAIVTGAGGGLGRSHALLLAGRGAKVVVNDLGGNRAGEGGGSEMADAVVDEIRATGGEAVANYDGVHTWEGGQAIVQSAIDAFGRVDVVVNNAGILRDVSFAKLEQDQLDLVLKVHLYGGFHVARAAWPHLREQGYGRIVNTTSGSGLYGNFGQSNYSAAKLGLVGLTRTLAIEGAKYGITANVIAPVAASRMTEDIMPPQLLERLEPDYVSPLVAYLAAEACTDTGRIYSVGGGYMARVAILEGEGATFDSVPSPDEVADAWDRIQQVGPDAAEFTQGVMEQTGKIVQALGIDVG